MPLGSFWGGLEAPGGFRDPNGSRAASRRGVGALRESSGGRLGTILGRFWATSGAILGRLGGILGRLGAILGRLEAMWSCLDAFLDSEEGQEAQLIDFL